MPSPKPSFEEIQNSAQEMLSSRCGITNFAEGSAAGTIVNILTTELGKIYDLLTQAEMARSIDDATGKDLDNLARPFGILRRPAIRAGSTSGSAQVMLTNNSAVPVTLSPSMSLWSPSNPSTRVYIASNAVIPSGGSAAIYVQSLYAGNSYNFGVGQLTAHNGPAGVAATNFMPISGGSYQEDDDAFRYRITQVMQSSLLGGPSSLSGIESALLSFPGVLDVILMSEARGAASLDAIIIPEGGTLPDDDFLSSVQEQMSRYAAAGISVRARAPKVVGITTEIVISASSPSYGLDSSAQLRASLQTLVENYINSRTVGVPTSSRTYYRAGGDGDSNISYSTLLAMAIDTARAALGPGFRSLSLIFSVDGGGATLNGDLYGREGEVFRSRSVTVRLSSSNV